MKSKKRKKYKTKRKNPRCLARIFCILFGNWKLEIENCENFL